jgi:transposase
VERVELSPEDKRIDVWLVHRRRTRFPCPECGLELPPYDHTAHRAWRYLDSGPFRTWVHTQPPRVRCLCHGTRQALLPWALPYGQFTSAFERWAIDVLRETDVLGATRLLAISWDEAWGIMERAVTRGRRAKRPQVITHLGVDEKAVAKGQSYFTVVNDLARGTVE